MSGAKGQPPAGQLSLFGGAASEPSRADAPKVDAHLDPDACELGTQLPSWIRFGTSSWTFPGWSNILWKGSPSTEALARDGLRAYAEHPLFRTVGVDRSYYGPLREEDVAAYAKQIAEAEAASTARGLSLPPFRFVSKVWDELTTAFFPAHPRYGARAGTKNPGFLDVERFLTEVLPPYRAVLGANAGPFVFELTPMPRNVVDPRALVARVERFVARLPAGFQWAFELRNAEFVVPRWFDMLAAHGAAHVFNYWTAMPDLRAQLAYPRALGARFVVARLMLPPYTKYEAKKAEYAPFNRLVAPQEDMRDDVLLMLRAAAARESEAAYVIVNNKAEGSAPLTVRALAERVVRELR